MTEAMKVLVLGAAGQVGSEIDTALTSVSESLKVECPTIINMNRDDCDVGDPSAIEAVIAEHQLVFSNYCFNCTWIADITIIAVHIDYRGALDL